MNRPVCLAPTLALLLAASSGCGGGASGAEPTARSRSPLVEEGRGYLLTVINAGEAPRRELRFDIAEGTSATASMEMTQIVQMVVGEQPMPPSPPIRTRALMRFSDIRRDGDLHEGKWSIDGMELMPTPGMPPEFAAQMEAALAPTTGTTGTVAFDGQGRIERSDTDIPEDVSPQLRDMLRSLEKSFENIVIVFPSAPLGLGAEWQIQQDIAEPLAMAQTVRHRWVGIEGDALLIESSVIQSAGPQRMETPNGGPPFDVTSMEGRGSGRSTIWLDRIVGLSDTEVQISTVGVADAGEGQTVSMQMDTEVSVHIEAVPEGD